MRSYDTNQPLDANQPPDANQPLEGRWKSLPQGGVTTHPFDGQRRALPTTAHPTRLIFQFKKRKIWKWCCSENPCLIKTIPDKPLEKQEPLKGPLLLRACSAQRELTLSSCWKEGVPHVFSPRQQLSGTDGRSKLHYFWIHGNITRGTHTGKPALFQLEAKSGSAPPGSRGEAERGETGSIPATVLNKSVFQNNEEEETRSFSTPLWQQRNPWRPSTEGACCPFATQLCGSWRRLSCFAAIIDLLPSGGGLSLRGLLLENNLRCFQAQQGSGSKARRRLGWCQIHLLNLFLRFNPHTGQGSSSEQVWFYVCPPAAPCR